MNYFLILRLKNEFLVPSTDTLSFGMFELNQNPLHRSYGFQLNGLDGSLYISPPTNEYQALSPQPNKKKRHKTSQLLWRFTRGFTPKKINRGPLLPQLKTAQLLRPPCNPCLPRLRLVGTRYLARRRLQKRRVGWSGCCPEWF